MPCHYAAENGEQNKTILLSASVRFIIRQNRFHWWAVIVSFYGGSAPAPPTSPKEQNYSTSVIEQKVRHPALFLEAAIPYGNRLTSTDPLFRKCLEGCNGIKVQQKEYGSQCFMNRNRYMVALSSRIIAVYDGREKGGTLFTIRYAHTMEREIREIRI